MKTEDLSRLRIKSDQKWTRDTLFSNKLFVGIMFVATAIIAILVVMWTGVLKRPVEVNVAKVAMTFPSKALTILNASGYVVAQRKAAVSSKATGRLEKLYVEEGRRVKQGDTIAQLENRDLKATLDEAMANLRVTRANLKNAVAELDDATLNYNRQSSLKQSGSVSIQAVDSAEARFKKAMAAETSAKFSVEKSEASVKVAEVNLEQSFIMAPFDGVILTKSAEEGEVVAPMGASLNAKASVVTMADMSSLMVEVDVSESSLEKVKLGAPAEIRLDAFPNDRFSGTVHMIVPTADRSKATVLTKVKFDKLDDKVLPEMSAKVAFLSRPLSKGENVAFLGMPLAAVKSESGNDCVFQVEEGIARLRTVKLGRKWDDTSEVLSGLKEGDLVIIKSTEPVHDKSKIKVKD
jgi:RND family efflux transporter MFP subunit